MKFLSNILVKAGIVVEGSTQLNSLAGVGTRMVVTNAAGVVSTQAIPVSSVTSVFGRAGVVTAASGDYTTAQVTESGNLYYTDARARAAISVTGSGSYNPSTGVITINNVVTSVNSFTGAVTLTTTNISEGTNLYYTNARSRSAISVSGAGSYDSATGVITINGGVLSVNGFNGIVTLTTTNIAEGTGLYYTDARSRAAISVAGSGTYNSATGLITINGGVTSVNGFTGAVTLTTANIAEGINLYYTDARARAAISLTTTGSSGAATYSAGVLNIPTYTIAGLGGVSGTAVANQLSYWADTSVIAGSAALTFNGTTLTVNSVSVGRGAGSQGSNTALGSFTLVANSSGVQNTAVGNEALRLNTTGLQNSAFGYRASRANTTGSTNSAFGIDALRVNTTGSNNAAFGAQALDNNTVGNNTGIGMGALLDNTSGGSNTALGYRAGYAGIATANSTGSNNIFIGSDSIGEAASDSNRTFIGNTSTASTWLGGRLHLGARTDDAVNRLQVTGSSAFSGVVYVNTNASIGGYGHSLQVLANAAGGMVVSTTNTASGIGIINSSSSNKTWDISPFNNNLAINESGVGARMYFFAGGNITVGGITNSSNLFEVLGTFKTTGVNTLSNLQGTGNRMVVADANGVLSTQAIPGGSITGTGVSSQVVYWTGASSQAGSAAFTFGPNSRLFLNNNVTSATNVARAFHVTSQLNANANNDDLVGIDLSPVYTTTGLPANVHAIGIRTASSFTPTQTDLRYTAFSIQPSINQGGTATGITRGIHVNPTISAVVDWRSIEWSNNLGWGLYGVGTAKNYLNGTTLIGTATDDGTNKLQVAGSISATADSVINGVTIGKGGGSGALNTAVGSLALSANTTGASNTAFGLGALATITTGSDNVAIGTNAGRYRNGTTSNVDSSGGVYIGNASRASAAATTNEIVIGAGAQGSGNNTVTIGNTGITATVLRGNVSTNGSVDAAGFIRSNASRTAAVNDVSIALNGNNTTTYAAGFTMGAAGYGLNAIYAQHEQRFGGDATFNEANINGGGLILNKLAPTATGTVTMSQVGSGRTMSNLHLMTQFEGNNNLTVTHMSGLHIYGHYRTSGSGTLTVSGAYYGILLADPNEFGAGATITGTNWGFYQAGAAPNNYFGGKVLIGTTTTTGTSKLRIVGLPTSAAGLGAGEVWNNGGVLTIA